MKQNENSTSTTLNAPKEESKIRQSIEKILKLKIIAQPEELSNNQNQNISVNNNNENNNKNDRNIKEVLEYKILIIGEHLTGKTSFCLRFALNEFNLEIKSSSQSECFLKTMLLFDKEIKVYLIDVAVNSLNHLREEVIKDVKGIIIIYDITKAKTYDLAEKLITDIRKKFGNILPLLLVGNKNDLKFLRNVDYEEANEKANSNNCELKETNCIDEDSVHNTIKYFVAKIFFDDLEEEERVRIKKEVLKK